MDQRGFGESGWSAARKYDLKQQAADTVAVLDQLGWKQAILMGHSAGGRIALCTASWYRDRVKAYISVDFAPDLAAPGRRKVAEQIGRQPNIFASVDEALQYHKQDPALPADAAVRKRYEAFLEQVPGGYRLKRDLHYRDQFKHVLDTGQSHPAGVDGWALLKELDIPALVIRASGSELFAKETMAKVRDINPAIEVVELDGGHDLATDNPNALVQTVRAFIDRVG